MAPAPRAIGGAGATTPSLSLRVTTLAIGIAAALFAPAAGGLAMNLADSPQNPTARIEIFSFPPAVGTLTVPAGNAGRRLPAVVLVPDVLGSDPRSEPYAEQLSGAGVAVLELHSEENVSTVLALAAEMLAEDPRIDGSRIGVLSFGAGGVTALAAQTPFAAWAFLYPGCAQLQRHQGHSAAWVGIPVLLAYGGNDPANPRAACTETAETLERAGAIVRRLEYAHAGYAWDYPSFQWGGRSLLFAPGDRERIVAQPWPELTVLSAAQAAGFFGRILDTFGHPRAHREGIGAYRVPGEQRVRARHPN